MIVDSFKRGIFAGVVTGVAYGLVLALISNPLVEQLEHADHDHASHGHEAVSELTTAFLSIGSGVLWGVLLGAAFGVTYYLFEPSLPGDEDTKVYVLAAAGFLTVSGVPWLALPPVAPGTEQIFATDIRLIIYGAMMILGLTICVLSIMLFQYQRRRNGRSSFAATGIAATPFLLCVVPIILIPTNLSNPPEELAVVFQWFVVLSQGGLWLLLAGIYTRLKQRADDRTAPALDNHDDDFMIDI